jgi:hypothetical protein
VDRIKEMIDQLAELDDASVAELQQAIVTEFESVESQEPTQQSVDAMTTLADMLDAVRSELRQRETAAAELAEKANEAATRVYGEGDVAPEDGTDSPESSEEMPEETPEPQPEAMQAEDDRLEEEVPAAPVMEEEAEADAPVLDEDEEEERKPMGEMSTDSEEAAELSNEDETDQAEVVAEPEEAEAADEGDAVADAEDGSEASSNEDTTTNEPVAQNTLEAPVTAAADENLEIEVPADRRPAARTTVAAVAITAGADIPGYTAGSTLESMSAVAEAMAKRIHTLRRVNGGDGEQHIVASITTQFPEERTLTTDAESNWAKIQNVVSPEALVAAGGHQAPFEARYEIFSLGVTNRPVRDSLPRFQADRGGIRYITPPVLADYGDAVGVWTEEVDKDPDGATKAELVVQAAEEVAEATDAVTLQLQFGNLMTRAYPELVARHNELGLIQHARVAEQYLLGKIEAGSTAVTTTSAVGFARDFLVQVAKAGVAYRSRHRLAADATLRVILPSWVKDAMATDLALQMPGDSTLNAYGEIDGYLAARNITATYSLDQSVYGAQGAGALLDFAADFTWYLFAEGTFLFLDGGTLDLGIIRDSSLVGTNDYKMFVETFEGLAKVGVESLAIESAINITGAAAALVDTTGAPSA